MFNSDCLGVNSEGNLTIGNLDTVLLAKKYQTPLYVMDEDMIRNICRIYKNSIDEFYKGHGLVLYASKALSCKYIYKVAKEEGLGVDVVSGGELYTALQAGFPAEKIYFHGNNKTYDEIKMAVESGVGHLVVDNDYELTLIDEICQKENKTMDILFRIKPGIDAHTHDFVKTGQIDAKFGVALENGEAEAIIKRALEIKTVRVTGVHCHIGSQIFDIEPFKLAASVMVNFMADIKAKYGLELKELNLGGGYGIMYTSEDDPIEYHEYIKAVSQIVYDTCEKRSFAVPFILMEPGRSIVGASGITLYTVGDVKEIKDIKKYVFVDGGMGDNPRYILYESKYDALIANRAKEEKNDVVTIAGKCCESGDVLASNIAIQKAQPGDTLAVLATGAYNYSMASNYNRIPRPPIVMVSGGKDKLVVKRESYEDLVKNDLDI
jgi:diaminopimelate decarboxylase